MKHWTALTVAALMVGAALGIGCGGHGSSSESASAAAPAPAEGGTGSAAKPAAAAAVPTYREITLPAGTTLALDLKTAVGSDTSQVEDAVRATLRRAVAMKGTQVLPAGTEVVGAVTQAERSGRVKGRARVAFRFTSLNYDGERYDIRTESIARVAEATKGEDAKKVAIGALLGGGSGAAKGAAIGGAGGTGVVLATRGKEVRLGAGADVNTKLTAPLTVRVKVS